MLLLFVNRYTSKKHGDRVQIKATTREELLSIGVDEDAIEEYGSGRLPWGVRGDAEDMEKLASAAEEARVSFKTMKSLWQEPSASVFFRNLSKCTVGTKLRKAFFGVSSLPVSWDRLIALMYEDGWIDEKLALTKVGQEEAQKGYDWIAIQKDLFGKGGASVDGDDSGG